MTEKAASTERGVFRKASLVARLPKHKSLTLAPLCGVNDIYGTQAVRGFSGLLHCVNCLIKGLFLRVIRVRMRKKNDLLNPFLTGLLVWGQTTCN